MLTPKRSAVFPFFFPLQMRCSERSPLSSHSPLRPARFHAAFGSFDPVHATLASALSRLRLFTSPTFSHPSARSCSEFSACLRSSLSLRLPGRLASLSPDFSPFVPRQSRSFSQRLHRLLSPSPRCGYIGALSTRPGVLDVASALLPIIPMLSLLPWRCLLHPGALSVTLACRRSPSLWCSFHSPRRAIFSESARIIRRCGWQPQRSHCGARLPQSSQRPVTLPRPPVHTRRPSSQICALAPALYCCCARQLSGSCTV